MAETVGVVPRKDDLLASPNKYVRVNPAGQDFVYDVPAPVTLVRKTADQTVNNSTDLVNDNTLLLAVAANEKWAFLLPLKIATTAVADFKYKFTVPTNGAVNHLSTREMFTIGNWNSDADIAFALIAVDKTNIGLAIFGIYVGGDTAGTLQYQWAQSTAEATNTQVLANSCLIAWKLP